MRALCILRYFLEYVKIKQTNMYISDIGFLYGHIVRALRRPTPMMHTTHTVCMYGTATKPSDFCMLNFVRASFFVRLTFFNAPQAPDYH